MKRAHSGFTLAELLIALALLGVIAAFTIPKVLNAAGTTEAASKLKETVATLEGSFYELKMRNSLLTGVPLYNSLLTNLNAAQSGTGAIPATVLPAGHPCVTNANNGWFQFQNGVVVSGTAPAGAGYQINAGPWTTGAQTGNYLLCIDVNGSAGTQLTGTDVFYGNFNQWGRFIDAQYTANTNWFQTSKSFNWGGALNGSATPVILNAGVATNFIANCNTATLGCASTVLVQQ